MPAPELTFYTNLIVPGITENGHDVVNENELDSILTSKGYLTANQNITLSGAATGSCTTSITVALSDSGVTAGSYKLVTVNAKGLVTGGSNPTTLNGFGITDAQPLDSDLSSIAGLSGTTGILKKTAANTWSLDTSAFATSVSMHYNTTTVSTDYTALSTDTVIIVTANATITLPTANTAVNKLYVIKRVAVTATISVVVNGGGNIDASSTVTIGSNYSSITVVSDGTTWYII